MLHVFIYLSPRSYKYPTGEARKCVSCAHSTAVHHGQWFQGDSGMRTLFPVVFSQPPGQHQRCGKRAFHGMRCWRPDLGPGRWILRLILGLQRFDLQQAKDPLMEFGVRYQQVWQWIGCLSPPRDAV